MGHFSRVNPAPGASSSNILLGLTRARDGRVADAILVVEHGALVREGQYGVAHLAQATAAANPSRYRGGGGE